MDIEKMTGQTKQELREKLIEAFNERSADSQLWIAGPEGAPALHLYEKGGFAAAYNWPDLDLNLMALIVGVMTEEEKWKFGDLIAGCVMPSGDKWHAEMRGADEEDWYLVAAADAPTRFLAALLTLGLATLTQSEGEEEKN